MLEYYYLYCETCKERFQPLLATSPEELLYPDYEDFHGGTNNLESLRSFHERHRSHGLDAVRDQDAA
jgi:hypothetical protein